jgi:hypothetical protein
MVVVKVAFMEAVKSYGMRQCRLNVERDGGKMFVVCLELSNAAT